MGNEYNPIQLSLFEGSSAASSYSQLPTPSHSIEKIVVPKSKLQHKTVKREFKMGLDGILHQVNHLKALGLTLGGLSQGNYYLLKDAFYGTNYEIPLEIPENLTGGEFLALLNGIGCSKNYPSRIPREELSNECPLLIKRLIGLGRENGAFCLPFKVPIGREEGSQVDRIGRISEEAQESFVKGYKGRKKISNKNNKDFFDFRDPNSDGRADKTGIEIYARGIYEYALSISDLLRAQSS